MQEMTSMKIGQLAARAGVTVDTVRFYERRGVLPVPTRRASGYRVYGGPTLEKLRLVKALQSLGLSLDEVVDVAKVMESGTASCDSEQWRLEAVLTRLDGKIDELQQTRGRLADVLHGCRTGNCKAYCADQ